LKKALSWEILSLYRTGNERAVVMNKAKDESKQAQKKNTL